MYEVLERDIREPKTITKEGIISKVSAGVSVTIKDELGNPFNITRFDEFHIKIYPLVSVNFAAIWYDYAGKLLYPADYDPKWVTPHTINIPTLMELLA